MLTWDDEPPQFLNAEERKRLALEEQDRKRQEDEAGCWNRRFALWRLTRAQRHLFCLLAMCRQDGWTATRHALLRAIYGTRPGRKTSKKKERRSYDRLRQLQKRLNDRLRLARAPYVVESRKSVVSLRLVGEDDGDSQGQNNQGAERAAPGMAWDDFCRLRCRVGMSMGVEECKYFLTRILADAPVPVWEVKKQLAEKKCRPGTLKRVRKQLGVVTIRQGYGGDGEWLMALPDRNVTE
jgi:hypothetical protein